MPSVFISLSSRDHLWDRALGQRLGGLRLMRADDSPAGFPESLDVRIREAIADADVAIVLI